MRPATTRKGIATLVGALLFTGLLPGERVEAELAPATADAPIRLRIPSLARSPPSEAATPW